jgi:hypothetical protein
MKKRPIYNIRVVTTRNFKAFTAAEFIVVLAMIVIILGIVLSSFSNARAHARDQARIANIKKIEVGLAQFHQICGYYPAQLDPWTTCEALSAGNQGGMVDVMLINLIADINLIPFNQGLDYWYVATTHDSSLTGLVNCGTGYHIGVILEESNSKVASTDSQFDSKTPSVNKCLALPNQFATTPSVVVSGFTGVSMGTKSVYDSRISY